MHGSSLGSEFRDGVISVVTEAGGIVVVCLEGEFDLANAADLADQIERAHKDGTGLIIDLSDATFIDSTVIHVLISASKVGTAAGKPVVLQVAPSTNVERAIGLSASNG